MNERRAVSNDIVIAVVSEDEHWMGTYNYLAWNRFEENRLASEARDFGHFIPVVLSDRCSR